ncbi:MAG: ABC transporter ATP-binding protein [Clostridia bacterium]|nr:ABC transporter ATP-binding protein [Clostridia bacterium]
MGNERVIALRSIDLTFYEGEICSIFGASGSGKSTLLNLLAGMEKPNRGQIVIDGTDITKLSEDEMAEFRQRNIGFVFQSYNLLPMLTAEENVAMPLMFLGMDRAKRLRAADVVLREVGLAERLRHYPSQMSGGQQQRTGIARAFVARPKIVFADEPTGNLDSKTTVEIMNMMVRFARQFGETLILVTHNPELVEFTDRIITLKDGEIIEDSYTNQEEKHEALT